jgi:hypothetical protein
VGLVAVALAAFAPAGCGGDRPHLARADAAPLIALSKQIAGEGRCAQARDIPRLQARAIRLVNARRVPAALQETLLGGVNQLAARTPVCVPRVTPVTSTPAPPVTTVQPTDREQRRHHPKKHGHGKDD